MKIAACMTVLSAVCVSALLTGCSSKPVSVDRCEAVLLSTLKAPSTYRLIEKTISLPKPDGTLDVFLSYDAANSYNAPLRGIFWCSYDPRRGVATPAQSGTEMQADNMDVEADIASAKPAPSAKPAKSAEPDEPQEASSAEDEVPVCDRPDSPSKLVLMDKLGVDCIPD